MVWSGFLRAPSCVFHPLSGALEGAANHQSGCPGGHQDRRIQRAPQCRSRHSEAWTVPRQMAGFTGPKMVFEVEDHLIDTLGFMN
eukprot:13337695-Alexandrium_andersonii.AAC.1